MSEKKVAYYNMPRGIDYEEELLREWGIQDIRLTDIPRKDGVSTEDALKDYDGIVTEYTLLSEETLRALPRLKIIALQTIGYDEIDTAAARNLGIDVTNAQGYCAEDVATHAMALLLGLIRQIPMFDREVHNGRWNPFEGKNMNRLSGKTAGLVSFGNIPQKLTPMLQGFGVNISAFDPGKSKEFMEKFGVEKSGSLEELLKKTDFVFLHTPLTSQTRHMINEKTVGYMKEGALLINVSRGGLIDEKVLVRGLEQKWIAGAGLDVLEDEENRTTELLRFPNVIITPHTAFLSEESLKQGRQIALKQLVKKLSFGEQPDNIVNPERKGGENSDGRYFKGNGSSERDDADLAQTAS